MKHIKLLILLAGVLLCFPQATLAGPLNSREPGNGTGMSFEDMSDVFESRIKNDVVIVEPVYDKVVRSYLRRYLEAYPEYTSKMIGRGEIYFPMISAYLSAYGLPEDLKYLAVVESGLRSHVTSPVGAAGMWQFMPGTGRQYGLQVNNYLDERRDPEKATEAAVRFLGDLYEKFGSWELAMAGYNAGPGRVSYAIRRAGSRDFAVLKRYLPRETRNYVSGFIAANHLFKNYAEYGLAPEIPQLHTEHIVSLRVFKGLAFKELNKVSGVPYEDLTWLNPMYVRRYIPHSPHGHVLRVPGYAVESVANQYGPDIVTVLKAPESRTPVITSRITGYESRSTAVKHTVERGESLYKISKLYNCTVDKLVRWNKLGTTTIKPGQQLRVYVVERVAIREMIQPRPMLDIPPLQTLSASGLYAPAAPKVQAPNWNTGKRPQLPGPPASIVVLQRRMTLKHALGSDEARAVSIAPGKPAVRQGYVITMQE